MRPARRGRRRLALGAAILAATAGTASAARAQESWRIQAAWADDHVLGAVVGYEIRQPLGRLPPQPAEGPRVVATRNWMVTGMVAGGVNLDGPGSRGVEGLIYAHLGVLRRLGGGLEPRVGVVGVFLGPAGIGGPAGRLELMDVAAVQAGWMVGDGAYVAVEVAGGFVCDLWC